MFELLGQVRRKYGQQMEKMKMKTEYRKLKEKNTKKEKEIKTEK